MKVYKFGGASVRSGQALVNLKGIISDCENENLIVVVSAMGKTTNALEDLQKQVFSGNSFESVLRNIKEYHESIISELESGVQELMQIELNKWIEHLEEACRQRDIADFDAHYDRIVGFGELISSSLIGVYLSFMGIPVEWLDIRNVIKTDSQYRKANVNWDESAKASETLQRLMSTDQHRIIITQGFISSDIKGNPTTLGREGSDFSAAILAYLCDAKEVVIWKDVPGMLNADPKWFNNTVKLDQISYREAIELSYYGASVIHPKTIKPLQNKNIQLWVKSFIDPSLSGTLIHSDGHADAVVASYIFKENQVLMSITPRDFSFVAEHNLRDIFEALSKTGISISLMQNSAISFSIVFDDDKRKREVLAQHLQEHFLLKHNSGLKLLTIRHYDKAIVSELTKSHEILLEQRSRQTLRIAMREA